MCMMMYMYMCIQHFPWFLVRPPTPCPLTLAPQQPPQPHPLTPPTTPRAARPAGPRTAGSQSLPPTLHLRLHPRSQRPSRPGARLRSRWPGGAVCAARRRRGTTGTTGRPRRAARAAASTRRWAGQMAFAAVWRRRRPEAEEDGAADALGLTPPPSCVSMTQGPAAARPR